MVFRPYTRLAPWICTSQWLRTSTTVSWGLVLARHSSLSFGLQRIRYSVPAPPATMPLQLKTRRESERVVGHTHPLFFSCLLSLGTKRRAKSGPGACARAQLCSGISSRLKQEYVVVRNFSRNSRPPNNRNLRNSIRSAHWHTITHTNLFERVSVSYVCARPSFRLQEPFRFCCRRGVSFDPLTRVHAILLGPCFET